MGGKNVLFRTQHQRGTWLKWQGIDGCFRSRYSVSKKAETRTRKYSYVHDGTWQNTGFRHLACVVAICCLVDTNVLLYVLCCCAGPNASCSALIAVRKYCGRRSLVCAFTSRCAQKMEVQPKKGNKNGTRGKNTTVKGSV